MKYIKFKRLIPAVVQDMPDGSKKVIQEEYFQDRGIYFTDVDKETQIAEALKIAYNGEYTIEDDGQPEPELTPTTEQRVSDIEEQIIQADEADISLYEAQQEQETINAQQDEALMEIYEMLG